MLLGLLITGIVFFGLAIIFLVGIIFVYVKNYKCKQKENSLKKKVNELMEYNFEKINIPIEHISYSSRKPEFESMKELFNNFASKFDNKVTEIKKTVRLIPEVLDNYDWKNFSTLYQKVNHEILILKKSVNKIFEIHSNLLKYRDYISYLLVSYRENAWNLINFFNKNLLEKNEKTKDIKLKIKILKKCTEDLNKCIENYDISTTVDAIDRINESLVNLIKLVGDSYIIKKQNNYINYSINEIKNIINKNHQKIKDSVINNAQKEISKVENNRDYLIANSNNLSNHDIERITISLIKVLSKVKKTLNITFKSSEFFNQNKSEIDKTFRNMIQIVPLILKTFEKIFSNFIDDKDIKDLILLSNTSFSEIVVDLNDYFITSNKNNYNPGELLENARNIIKKIIDTLSLADRIVLDVNKKYEYSKKILNDITANKLILAQMKAFAIENQVNKNCVSQIDKLNTELNNIEKKFFEEKANNLEYNFNYLSETKVEISTIELNLLKQEKMKAYVEKIVNYACLQMVLDENLKIKLEKPINHYNAGEYKESISLLVTQIKK